MSWSSSSVPVRAFDGLDAALRSGDRSAAEFRLKRDAGTFVCRGVIQNGSGGGLYRLELDPSYAAALERRGIGRPTPDQQARLAYADAGFARASLEQLRSARDHGVDPQYAASMSRVGFTDMSLEDLIRARDHGVDASYVMRVRDREREKPTLDEVIRLRDRGY
jgi:hypothetical protein